MAGSYSHVEKAWSLVENMGDAAETVEELLWLVWYFARKPGETLEETDATVRAALDGIYFPMRRREIPKDDLLPAVDERMGR